MSVNAVDQSTGATTPLAGNTNNLVGNLSALTTSVKSDAVGAINEVNANKQNATDNSLQTTDKTVVGAVNELKSGLTNVDVALSVPDNSGKNLIPLSLANYKTGSTTGTWASNVYSVNGIDFTVNTDANGAVTSISASGTASALAMIELTMDVKKGAYILNGCPSGGSGNYYVQVYKSGFIDKKDTGDGVDVSITSDNSVRVICAISNGTEVSDIAFYPMLRDARISDATYTPYIPSVESRIEAVESGKANVATYNMGGGQTVNIQHTGIVAIMSDRGGLYCDGIANRGLNDLVASTHVTVTHVDAAHVTVANNSQYGTSILVLSDGDITITLVR